MNQRVRKLIVLAEISGLLLLVFVCLSERWQVFLNANIWFAMVGGVAAACFGFMICRQLKSCYPFIGQIKRVDHLPEPLGVGGSLYETDVDRPLDGWLLHDRYQVPSELSYQAGVFKFFTPAETMDEWDYIYLDPKRYRWSDYSWQLRIKRETSFREFAFNFRYQDFDNRYRYRFEDNKIFFDKKVKGVWSNNIASCPFPMVLDRWYDLRIDVCATLCRCYVDGRLWLENTETDLGSGTVSVILWESDGVTDIKSGVGPMSVSAIEGEGCCG